MVSIKFVLSGSAAIFGASCCISYFKGSPWFFEYIGMPITRAMDPERAHKMSVFLASRGFVPRTKDKDPEILKVKLWGKELSNPIGLAAGFDKHAEAYVGMLRLGFGFVEVGSVTPEPQPGNPTPRVFRLKEDKAIINRYGFNSHGHQTVAGRLKVWPEMRGLLPSKMVGVNLGKNKTSDDACADYVRGVRTLGPHADYIVVNVSCPNMPGVKDMQGRKKLEELLDKVLKERDQLSHRPPLLIKMAPDLTQKDKEDIAAVISRPQGSADGLIVSNTTVSRPASLKCSDDVAAEAGGLSGRPLRDLATQTIADMYSLTNGKVLIVGVGGVSSGCDAYEKIRAGASVVQLYTALAYHGPHVVRKIKKELADILKSEGYSKVSEAVGADHRAKLGKK